MTDAQFIGYVVGRLQRAQDSLEFCTPAEELERLRGIQDTFEKAIEACSLVLEWWIEGAYLPEEISDAIESVIAKAEESK